MGLILLILLVFFVALLWGVLGDPKPKRWKKCSNDNHEGDVVYKNGKNVFVCRNCIHSEVLDG